MLIEIPVFWPKEATQKDEAYQNVLSEIGVKPFYEGSEDGVTVINTDFIKAFNESSAYKDSTTLWIHGDGDICYQVRLDYEAFKAAISETQGEIKRIGFAD